jgi:hypothetical protein
MRTPGPIVAAVLLAVLLSLPAGGVLAHAVAGHGTGGAPARELAPLSGTAPGRLPEASLTGLALPATAVPLGSSAPSVPDAQGGSVPPFAIARGGAFGAAPVGAPSYSDPTEQLRSAVPPSEPTPTALPSPPASLNVSNSGLATRDTLFVGNGSIWAGNVHPSPVSLPEYAAYDPVTGFLYVSSGSSEILVVDPGQFTVVGSVNITVPAGNLVYDPFNGLLIVESQGTVVGVNPANASIAFRIPVPDAEPGRDGTLVFDPASDSVWVTYPYSANVSVVDLDSLSIVAHFSVGGGFNDILGGVYDPVDREVYLSYYESNVVEVFNATSFARLPSVNLSAFCCFLGGLGVDPVSGAVFAAIDLVPTLVEIAPFTNVVAGSTALTGFPSSSVFDPGSGELYVPDADKSQISIVDPTNLTVLGTVPLPQDNPFLAGQLYPIDVATLHRVYVPTYWGDTIDQLSTANVSVAGTIDFLTRAGTSVWDPACGCVAVTDPGVNLLRLIDPASLQVTATIALPSNPRDIAYDNRSSTLWLTAGGFFGASEVLVLNASTGARIATLTDPDWPSGIVFDSADNRVFVADPFGPGLRAFNAGNLTTIGTIATGNFTETLAYDPSTDRVYSTNYSGTIAVVNATSDTIAGTLHVPGSGGIFGLDPATQDLLLGVGYGRNLKVVALPSGANVTVLPTLWPAGVGFDGNGTIFAFNDTGRIALVNDTTFAVGSLAAGASTTTGTWVPGVGLLASDPWEGAVYLVATSAPNLLTNLSITLSPEVVGVGAAVTLDVGFAGGTGPYTFSYVGLPPGCTNANATTIACTPNAVGEYRIGVNLSDALGHAATLHTTLWVLPVSNVTVNEAGLPLGTNWSFSVVGGPNLATTGSSLSFSVPYGTYGYAVADGNDLFGPVSGHGLLVIGNGSVGTVISFYPTYNVSFAESGLWPNTPWSLVIQGFQHASNGSSITLRLVNGTYPYQAPKVAGWAGPIEGNVTVAGNSLVVSLTFVRLLFSVEFVESGLSNATVWNVTFNGTWNGTNSSVFGADVPNGMYRYLLSAPPGYYVASPAAQGSVQVAGANATIDVRFAHGPSYSFTAVPVGLPFSQNFCVVLSAVNCTFGNLTFRGLSPGRYTFWVTSSPGYRTGPQNRTFTIGTHDVTRKVVFHQILDTVAFLEVGLRPYTKWSVTLVSDPGAVSYTRSGRWTTLGFHVPAGLYNYTVPRVPGYHLVASGAVLSYWPYQAIYLYFTPFTYNVTFNESGLPNSTFWGVKLGGQTHDTYATSLTFAIRNGTFTVGVVKVAGYTAQITPQPLTVAGAPVSVTVVYTRTA